MHRRRDQPEGKRQAVEPRMSTKDMAFDFKNRQTVVKALCLHVAHTCNLNCSYCFASGPLSGRPCAYELRSGQACHGFPDRKLRHPPQSGGGTSLAANR